MVKGKLALIGVGARVETHPDGTKTLVLAARGNETDVEVIVPFSEDGADAVSKLLASDKHVVLPGPGLQVPRA